MMIRSYPKPEEDDYLEASTLADLGMIGEAASTGREINIHSKLIETSHKYNP
jgi:hypothetical protein